MTVQDRTTEFFAAIEAIQQRGTGAMQAAQLMNRLDDRQRLLSSTPTSASSVGLSQPRVLKERSEFTRMAAHIGRSIAATSAKLEQLATLAKKKSLFDDRPTEINDLTFSIKGDITQISGDLKHLESYLRSHSMGNNQIQEHSSNIVVSLQSKLASTSHSFKDVLEIRSSNLKEQKARRDQLSFAPSTSKALQPQQESALYQPEKKDFVSISMPQLQQQLIPAQDTSYLDSRAEAIEGIEKTIGDLAGLFQQLTSMINEHDDLVRRIDYNIEDVSTNVEGAQQQLMRYMSSISSDRWLMIRIFMILIVFFLSFVFFFL